MKLIVCKILPSCHALDILLVFILNDMNESQGFREAYQKLIKTI